MQQPNSIVHSVNRQNVVLLIGSNDNQLQWVEILLCWKSLASCYPALVEQVGWDGSTSCSGPPPPLQPPPSTVGRGQTNHSKWSTQGFGWNMRHIFVTFSFFWGLDLVFMWHFILIHYLAMKQQFAETVRDGHKHTSGFRVSEKGCDCYCDCDGGME